jgi:hypothetical protein
MILSPVRNAFHAGISITSASGRGLGLGNPDCFGPVKWDRAIRPVPFGAQMPALKALRTGPYQSEVHRQFYVCTCGPSGPFLGPKLSFGGEKATKL